MIIPLKSVLPTAKDVLNADLETLGGLLLRHLKSCDGASPVFQHGGLNRDYFIAIMERRNVGLGPLPGKEPEYGAKQPAVTRAFVEAWDWLVRDGLLIRNHAQPAEWYLISRKGESFLQNCDSRERPAVNLKDSTPDPPHRQSIVMEKWDVFISHASEDKAYVEPLAAALRAAGVSIWYDKTVLNWGDDLRPMIDNGLINCRFGIVVLSKAFLGKKKWTEHELNSLFAREQAGRKLVLPIWHGIARDDLLGYSPALADRLAKIAGSDSQDDIVRSMLDLLGKPVPDTDGSKRKLTGRSQIREADQPIQSNDLLTGPLTISAVLKGSEHQIVSDAYPTGDNGVHFVFSLFNGNAFDFLVNELDVDVLAYAPLNLDRLAHGVGATAVRRYFRATIRPERGSYVATYVRRQGEFVTIPPGKSEGFDVEISTRTEGLYNVCLRVHGGSAGKGFDVPLDSTKRRVAFFDRGAGYMVDRGLGGRMLTYDEYSLEMKSWGLSDY
jgi:hypothetical protein